MRGNKQLDGSHSVFLLGHNKKDPFHLYRQLMEQCTQEGKFLSFHDHCEWLSCYEKDSRPLHSKIPLLVFRPHRIENIASFLRTCCTLGLPVTVRCGGTGLTGGAVPNQEGIVLLTGHLKAIKHYDSKNGVLTVEPGTTIAQINRRTASDEWHLPLAMATNGVAGLAGCLCTNARSYHRQDISLMNFVDRVMIADRRGQVFEVPGPVVVNGKGSSGIVLEITLTLVKKPAFTSYLIYEGAWHTVIDQLLLLRSLQALAFVVWRQNRFYFAIEGEGWRMAAVESCLKKHFRGIENAAAEFSFEGCQIRASSQKFVFVSTQLASKTLPLASQKCVELAEIFKCECLQQADILNGALHIILQSEMPLHLFQIAIQQFFERWIVFVLQHRGTIDNCQGIGSSEESQRFMDKFQSSL